MESAIADVFSDLGGVMAEAEAVRAHHHNPIASPSRTRRTAQPR